MARPLDVKRLRRSLLIYASAGAFVIALVAAALTYLPLSDRLHESAVDSVVDVAIAGAYPIAELVAGRRKVARQITSRSQARILLEQYDAGTLPAEDFVRRAQPIFQDAVDNAEDVLGFARIAQNGAAEVWIGEHYDRTLWPADWQHVDSIVARGPQDTPHGLRTLLASPVRDASGRRIGTDIIGLDMQPVADRLQYFKAKGGGSTRVFLLFVREEVPLLLLADGSVEPLAGRPGMPVAEVMRAATAGTALTQISTADLIVAVAQTGVNGWSVVVTRAAEEVTAGLKRDLMFVALAVLALAALGTGGIYLLLQPTTGTLLVHADTLAHEVAEATRELNATMLQLAAAKKQSEQARDAAEQAFADLQQAQDTLIQSEKMASLGGLVAGVAHEINTPVGIVLTAASHLSDETGKLKRLYDAQDLSVEEMEDYLAAAQEATLLIQSNAMRAADLIRSFKQVAVDQTAGERRSIDLRAYIGEVLTSLRPKLKHRPITVTVEGPEDLVIDTVPGAVSQILTNLVMNSLTHAFSEDQTGSIVIAIEDLGSHVRLRYADDGKGIPPEHRRRVFDPFFTTRRDAGGSGLGLNILYNLVARTLGGSVHLDESVQRGCTLVVQFPKQNPQLAGLEGRT